MTQKNENIIYLSIVGVLSRLHLQTVLKSIMLSLIHMLSRHPLDKTRRRADLKDRRGPSNKRRRASSCEPVLSRPSTLSGVVIGGGDTERVRGRVEQLRSLVRVRWASIYTPKLRRHLLFFSGSLNQRHLEIILSRLLHRNDSTLSAGDSRRGRARTRLRGDNTRPLELNAVVSGRYELDMRRLWCERFCLDFDEVREGSDANTIRCLDPHLVARVRLQHIECILDSTAFRCLGIIDDYCGTSTGGYFTEIEVVEENWATVRLRRFP